MSNNLRFVKQFLILATITITIVVAGAFIGFYIRTEKLSIQALYNQSKALFDEIIVTRRWVTNNGGVYVAVRPGVNPNPYLTKILGSKVNHKDQHGKLYTLKNPGLVVREISQIADKSGLYRFHVSSLKPVNKKTNSPDSFEKKALKLFEKGNKEYFVIENTPQGQVYRYMAPLYYEKSCDRCHAHQGYKVGDIRGGISVTIPMSSVNQELQTNRFYLAGSAFLVLGLLFGALYLIYRRFIAALTDAQDRLVAMATTDDLTGMPNRKAGIDRLEEEISRHDRAQTVLCCLMLDIDHFKGVNDRYGHLVGDAVLVSFSKALRSSIRKHDFVCRYGGEEFMVLLPETGIDAAVTVAEKIRQAIENSSVGFNGKSIKITASIGVAQMGDNSFDTTDTIIYRADRALYKAKADGRNTVVVAPARESNQDIPCA